MLSALLLIFSFGVAKADMAQMRTIPVHKMIENAKQRQATDVVALLETARDALGIETMSVLYSEEEEAAMNSVNEDLVAYELNAAIRERKSWDAPLTKAGAATLKKYQPALRKALANEHHASRYAWILFHLGQKAEAKEILLAKFEAKAAEVMQLTEAVNGFRTTPLTEPEYLLKALRALSTPAELGTLEAKMQKMKIHISNLPQVQVVT